MYCIFSLWRFKFWLLLQPYQTVTSDKSRWGRRGQIMYLASCYFTFWLGFNSMNMQIVWFNGESLCLSKLPQKPRSSRVELGSIDMVGSKTGKLTSTSQWARMHGGAVLCSVYHPLKQLHGRWMLLSGYGPAGKIAVPGTRNGWNTWWHPKLP